MKKNIYIDSNIPYLAEFLEPNFNIYQFENGIVDKKLLTNTDSLICRSTLKVDKNLLQGTNVKFVGTATAGFDHFNLTDLAELGIDYATAAGSDSNSVAEYVVYGILKQFVGDYESLSSKTIGIVGFGNIGSKLAYYAHIMGIKNILINNPFLKAQDYNFPAYVHYSELEELISKSDIISNHVPLTHNGAFPTYNMFNARNLPLIKADSLFFHTSRGSVVCEKSLLNIFQEKRINLIIDVWENEPDFNLNLAKSAICSTPHIAGHALESKINGSMMMAKAISDFYKLDLEVEGFFKRKLEKENFKLDWKNLNSLFLHIQKQRQIEEDDKFIKSLINLEVADRKQQFKKYRAAYPIRLETLEYLY